MLEISNVEVFGLKRSVIACRNAMRLTPPEYTDEEFEKSLPRAIKLVQTSKNGVVKCHDNFLTGIRVAFVVKYPGYWTPEAQRYHWFDIVTSSSKMHKLLKMDIDKSCNKYVSRESINVLQRDINLYNDINDLHYERWKFTLRDGTEIITNNFQDTLYTAFMKCVSDCPMGIELFMEVETNYKQLQTMYHQRKNHKLKEDWGAFCKFVEELPYAKEFIL